MGRYFRIFIALVAVVGLTAGCQNDKIKELNAKNLALQEKLDESTNAQTRLIEEKGNLMGQLTSSRGQISQLSSENRGLGAKVDFLMQELAKKPEAAALPQGLVDALERFAKDNGEIVTLVGERVRFKSDILFASGSATVTPKGMDALKKFSDIFNAEGMGLFLRVDGHTDIDPIKATRKKYKDNWDLGYQRARNVSDILFSTGVAKERVLMASHSMYSPLVEDKTKEAKAKNRRVEILLLPAK